VILNFRRLLRYNFRIVLGHTYWLIIIPIAGSQIVMFWNVYLATLFTPGKAAWTTELVAPLMAAFLCAYVLAAEYRHRVGEITFCKPFAAGRILLLRLLAVYAFVGALTALALFVYTKHPAMPDLDLPTLVKAGLPSTFFLSFLAMTMATLFRQPVVGFLSAALYLALDGYAALKGVSFNPLLTLHSAADHFARQPFGELWVLSKWILLGLSAGLYLLNARLMARPEGPRNLRALARNVGLLVFLLVLYLGGGAWYKVWYGIHRIEPQSPKLARFWYREQFRIYGRLPVARLLGPAFPRYLGVLAATSEEELSQGLPQGRSERDKQLLQEVINQYPGSQWADNALFQLAEFAKSEGAQEGSERAASAASFYGLLVQRYPHSVFAPTALAGLARLGDPRTRRAAYQQLYEQYRDREEALEAVVFLAEEQITQGRPEQALRMYETAAQAAPLTTRYQIWQRAAQLSTRLNRRREARAYYDRALAAVDAQIQAFEDSLPPGEASSAGTMRRRSDLLTMKRQLQEDRDRL